MRILFILLLICSNPLFAETAKTGDFAINDAGISADIFEKVTGMNYEKLKLKPKDGKITFENNGKAISWQVHVPKNYNSSKPPGVFVYINSGNGGKIPGKWKELMEKHNLIWIGADNSGNDFFNYWRVSMALEGLRRIKELYSVNEERVYLSGFSGGGRISSLTAVSRPDVFKGAVYHCGCNAPPDSKSLKDAKKNYFVFITGTKDFNLNDTKNVVNSYKSSGFKNTKLMVVDGLGHKTPESKEMDQALEFLNTPLLEMGKEAIAKAEAAEKRKNYGDAIKFYKQAASYNVNEALAKAEAIQKEIDDSYASAKKAEEEKDFILALQTYDAIYKKFGKEIGAEAYKQTMALKKDKNVVLEIKAMAYYNKIAAAVKAGKSGEVVISALKKVIESAPGTKAAELAAKDLDNLK